MGLDDLRVGVHAGPGVVARFKGALLLVTGGAGITDRVGELVEACRTSSGAADRLRALGQQSDVPSFCALLDTKDGILVLISGAVALSAVMTGRRVELESTELGSWTEERLKGKPQSIKVGGTPVSVTANPLLDLQLGVVLGSAVELTARQAASAPATATAPPAAAAAPAPVAAAPEPEPAPSTVMMDPPVEAVPEKDSVIAAKAFDDARTMGELPRTTPGGGPKCANGHENPPGATSCWVCGLPVGDAAGGTKPLGRLVGAGGINLLIGRTLIIGRHPEEAPEVAAGKATALPTPAEDRGVSRVHAELRVDGANVMLVDRNSANGTYVKPPKSSAWIKLEPGHGVKIVAGTGIMIGDFELRLDPE